MATTITIAQYFAKVVKNTIPVIHRKSKKPMDNTANPKMIFPGIVSVLAAISAKITNITTQNILNISIPFMSTLYLHKKTDVCPNKKSRLCKTP